MGFHAIPVDLPVVVGAKMTVPYLPDSLSVCDKDVVLLESNAVSSVILIDHFNLDVMYSVLALIKFTVPPGTGQNSARHDPIDI
ncbi:MAG: hypothetical protein HY093_01535 [Candidatus Liptonbacteria bacterium]|nr:hypothetical protein [Candidatus Liptonbacteria bacterium]